MSLNKIVLQGRLPKDPERMQTPNGTAVARFSLAVDRDYTKDGEREADFIDCVAFKNSAEFVCKHFRKGNMAVVDGRLQVRQWKDKDQNSRRAAEVVVGSIYFCEARVYTGEAQQAAQTKSDEDFQVVDDRSDLPF